MKTLYLEDNLTAMRKMDDESVDIIYLDPPFNTNRNYNIVFRGPSGLKSQAQIQAFQDTWSWSPAIDSLYDETVTSAPRLEIRNTMLGLMNVLGKDRLMAYIVNMTARLIEMRRLLKPSGSIYLHCDPNASHYLKLVMDAVFGRDNFRNEIIWDYRTGGVSKRYWAKKHDVILYYSRNAQQVMFNPMQERIYHERPFFTSDKDNQGRHPDVYTPDVWSDIKPLINVSKERTGYPTQKPLALLERIIKASSNENDVVLDPFCGCGTAIHAAELLNRKWIGIDIEPMALSVLRERFEEAEFKVDFDVQGLPSQHEYDDEAWKTLAREAPFKFERAIIGRIDHCVPWRDRQVNDQGIDGVVTFPIGREEYRHAIVSVKGGARLNPSMMRDLHGTVQRESQHGVIAGILVCAYDPTPGMIEETRLAGTFEAFGRRYPKLSIITVSEMFRKLRENSPALPLPTSVPQNSDYRLARPLGRSQALFETSAEYDAEITGAVR